jgi:hypothetical protein
MRSGWLKRLPKKEAARDFEVPGTVDTEATQEEVDVAAPVLVGVIQCV